MSESAVLTSNGQQTPCDPWKFWATTLWTVLAIAAWGVAQFAVFAGMLSVAGLGTGLSPAEIDIIGRHAIVLSLVSIISAPAEIGIIALAVRRAGCSFADYVALVRPRRSYALAGLIGLVILLPLGDISSMLSGREIVPSFVTEAYRSAQVSGTVWLLFIALVIAAPLAEEIVFRGFMFRGYEASAVGPAGAILIPSAIWAMMHLQYESFFIFQIFLLGVVFGLLRWKSGSTLLTIALHAVVNLSALLQAAWLARAWI